MKSTELTVDTRTRQVVDITDEVAAFARGGSDGLLSVFALHATAGIALIETGSGTDEDLVATLNELLPRDDRYVHQHGSTGHGADHVLPALVSPSVVIPVKGGSLTLGTWQRIVLVDLNADNPERRVRLDLLSG
jgi:secondary thiamine-phosphate synthase enzyme